MALTEINSKGIKDGEIVNADIADDTIAEAKLDVSNAPTNGQFLQAQSGEGGGLTWATVTDTNTNVLAGGTITGDVIFDNATNAGKDITWDMSDDALEFADSTKAVFGAGADLKIYHDADDSWIDETGTGGLYIKSSDLRLKDAADNGDFLKCNTGGAVEAYYDNTKKFETTATGVTVTGSVTDDKGGVRTVPKVAKTSAYTLVASDAGKCISTNSGVTIPDAVFSAGDAVTIWNDSSSAITITQGSNFQLRKAGETSTGNVTLTNFGLATLWWNTGGTAVITGNLG